MRCTSVRRRTSRVNGFTLIELLVVISIIALLIGLLLPALGQARLAGYKAQGASNQKGIGLAIWNYATDYNDGFVQPVTNTTAVYTTTVGQPLINQGTQSVFNVQQSSAGHMYLGAPVAGIGYLLYADRLLWNEYVGSPQSFNDMGKRFSAQGGPRIAPSGVAGWRFTTAYPAPLAATAATAVTVYGCSYMPGIMWDTISYTGSVNGTLVAGVNKGFYNKNGEKMPKMNSRPYPSENMLVMDFNTSNNPQYAVAYPFNGPDQRNGAARVDFGTVLAAFFDGHVEEVKHKDINTFYARRANDQGDATPFAAPWGIAGVNDTSSRGQLNVPDPITGSYWPGRQYYPDARWERFHDSRNFNPLGSAALNDVDNRNVVLNQVTD